jgi:hypothetical protein
MRLTTPADNDGRVAVVGVSGQFQECLFEFRVFDLSRQLNASVGAQLYPASAPRR